MINSLDVIDMQLKVHPIRDREQGGYRNVAVLSPDVYPEAKWVKMTDYVYPIERLPDLDTDSILINSLARQELSASEGQFVTIEPFSDPDCGSEFEIIVKQCWGHTRHNVYEEEQLLQLFLELLQNCVISEGRSMAIKMFDMTTIITLHVLQGNNQLPSRVVAVTSQCPKFTVEATQNLFRDIKISDLGIGGLDAEIDYIFRRAFVSRTYDPKTVEGFGITHVKGVILYGPPGTGKTLIA